MRIRSFVILLSIFVCLVLVAKKVTPSFVNATPQGGEFVLADTQGVWNFKDHAKPLNLLYMGYAKCPNVCPLVLAHASEAFRQLTESDLSRVNFLFVSLDVEHDTAQSVSDYASQFFTTFAGLTGTRIQMDDLSHLFNASYIIEMDPSSYLGYSISHADRIYFLNSQGKVLDQIQNPRSSESILSRIREHL